MVSQPPFEPNCPCTPVRPSDYDPEIAGLGVLLGFVISGFLALTLSTVVMVLRHAGGRTAQRMRWKIQDTMAIKEPRSRNTGVVGTNSALSRETQDEQQVTPASLTSPLDKDAPSLGSDGSPLRRRDLLNRLSHLSPKTLQKCNQWAAGLERVLLGLSDQQLITSFIVLMLALFAPVEEAIPGASAGFAGDVVFYASVTHAATMIALRSYLRQHPFTTILRLVLLYLTFLGWAAVQIDWLTFVPWYLWDKLDAADRFAVVSQIMELVLLTAVYIDISIPIIHDDLITLQGHMKRKVTKRQLDEHQEMPAALRGWSWQILYRRRLKPIHIPLRSLYILWFLFGLGTANLYFDLHGAYIRTEWGFGQFLPLCLTILPFITLLETYHDLQAAANDAASKLILEEEEYNLNIQAPRPSLAQEIGSSLEVHTPTTTTTAQAHEYWSYETTPMSR